MTVFVVRYSRFVSRVQFRAWKNLTKKDTCLLFFDANLRTLICYYKTCFAQMLILIRNFYMWVGVKTMYVFCILVHIRHHVVVVE